MVMRGEASIPNELIMDKADEIQRLLSEQLGRPVHGIVISVLVEEDEGQEKVLIYPVNMGKWRKGVATPTIFAKWISAFAEYILTRLYNEFKTKENRDD